VDLGHQPWYSNYLVSIERMLLALNEAGVLLMSGTDVPVPLTAPGFSLHYELDTLVDVGLSPYDVLKTSTYSPALYLGELDTFGTVEVGKRADLVLLGANPLDDISNTQAIEGVMVRGRYFDRADLDNILDLVAKDYETARIKQSVIEIAFPVVVILVLGLVVWIFIRRRQEKKAS
jgi:adenine deaminase